MREMKDSGVSWIGSIPKTWTITKLKYVCCDFLVPMRDKPEFSPVGIPWCRIEDVDGHYLNGSKSGQYVSERTIRENCLKVNPTGTVISACSASVGETAIVTTPCCTNQTFIGLIASNKLVNTYLYYHMVALKDELKHMGSGTTITYVSQDIYRSIPIQLPAYTEQQRIADFLDRKCADIDNVLEKTKASIEEYRKLKQSVITEAVTKGVRGPRLMKDSGIEWIGEMPEEWDCTKVKYFINLENGSDPTTEGAIPVFGSGSGSFKTCGEYKEGPTVLLGRKGATLHIPHFIEGKYWNVDTAFNTTARNGFSLRLFYYLACCFDYKQYISQTTLPSMTQTCYENMYIPVPPHREQYEIASYLDQKCSEIDSLIESKERFIKELETYRKSLIYEYVTGKKEDPTEA